MISSFSNITRPDADQLSPVHPSEILLEDFLKPMRFSESRLARALGVPPRRVRDLIHGRRAMTTDMALWLARACSMEPRFWMNLQSRYELEAAAGRAR
jgi:addiction module HigA family antidote